MLNFFDVVKLARKTLSASESLVFIKMLKREYFNIIFININAGTTGMSLTGLITIRFI